MEKNTKFPCAFFIVAFCWSWLFWLPFVLAGAGIIPLDTKLVGFATILAAFGPGAGAFYCLRKYKGKGAIRQYLRGLRDFRFGWRAWLVPVLLFCGSAFIAWMLPEFRGEPRLPLSNVFFFPPLLLFMIILGGGQEELGWRGYILDHLEERLGPWLGNLVLGFIWFAWHLPLFFIPGTSQSFMGRPMEALFAFLLLVLGLTGILAWQRKASGKRLLPGLYAHGVFNASVLLFPVLVMKSNTAQPRGWIWVSLTFVIGMIMLTIRVRKTRFVTKTS